MKLVNIDIYQLNEKLKYKKLTCFGAGRVLQNFINSFGQVELVKKIEFIIDNDKKKQNTAKELYNQNVNIISVEKFCSDYQVKDYIILLMTDDAISVLEQLEEIEKLKDVEV